MAVFFFIPPPRYIDPSRDAYDVLLDDFEKGMTAARLDEIFAEVRSGLVPLIARVRGEGTPPDAAWLQGSYDVEAQAALCKAVALDLGFSLERGRLDVSVHPFTGGTHPTDVRMTTRFKPDDVMEGLTGAIHEVRSRAALRHLAAASDAPAYHPGV